MKLTADRIAQVSSQLWKNSLEIRKYICLTFFLFLFLLFSTAFFNYNKEAFDSYVMFLTPMCFVFSIFVAVLIGKRTIEVNRELALKKTTIDFIWRQQEEYYHSNKRKFYEVMDTLCIGNEQVHFLEIEVEDIVGRHLDIFEVLSVGIEQNIFDKEVVFLLYEPEIQHTWLVATRYILYTRENGNPRAYSEFEKLAVKYGGIPLSDSENK